MIQDRRVRIASRNGNRLVSAVSEESPGTDAGVPGGQRPEPLLHVGALVDIAEPGATGAFTHGSRFGGHARYIKTQPGKFMIAGWGLCVGRDTGESISDDYPGEPPWAFTGGTLKRVAVDVSGQPFVDLEREAQTMLMRE